MRIQEEPQEFHSPNLDIDLAGHGAIDLRGVCCAVRVNALVSYLQWIQLVVRDNVWLTKRAEVRDRRRATDRNAYSRASQSRSVHQPYAI
jgi:hypothetical protein